jgi:hypothetical protein
MLFFNDKDNVRLTEKQKSTVNYGNISGGKMMFALNVYNQYTGSVKELEIVKSIEIQRGFLIPMKL